MYFDKDGFVEIKNDSGIPTFFTCKEYSILLEYFFRAEPTAANAKAILENEYAYYPQTLKQYIKLSDIAYAQERMKKQKRVRGPGKKPKVVKTMSMTHRKKISDTMKNLTHYKKPIRTVLDVEKAMKLMKI